MVSDAASAHEALRRPMWAMETSVVWYVVHGKMLEANTRHRIPEAATALNIGRFTLGGKYIKQCVTRHMLRQAGPTEPIVQTTSEDRKNWQRQPPR